MSPTLITEMPRVSPSCTPAPPCSPLVTFSLLPQVPCVISLSPPAALLLLYDITNRSSFDNIRVGPSPQHPQQAGMACEVQGCFLLCGQGAEYGTLLTPRDA